MMIAGAHSVGGPDGGPGVPVTGWSREYGDVRVAHFIGLHAIQVLALIALALRRWGAPEAVRVRALLAAAASYASLFLLLLWQALRGQSIVAPDAATVGSLVTWALVTLIVLGWIRTEPARRGARRHGSDGRMTAEQLFSILNLITIVAWLAMICLPRVRWTSTVVPVALPLLLAVVYVVLVASTVPWSEGGFSSLAASEDALRQSVGTAGGMGALPRVRSLHRRVGGARRAAARYPAFAHRAGAGAHVPLRAGGLAALHGHPAVRGHWPAASAGYRLRLMNDQHDAPLRIPVTAVDEPARQAFAAARRCRRSSARPPPDSRCRP